MNQKEAVGVLFPLNSAYILKHLDKTSFRTSVNRKCAALIIKVLTFKKDLPLKNSILSISLRGNSAQINYFLNKDSVKVKSGSDLKTIVLRKRQS